MWRSWLAHLVWDQRVLCSSHSTPTQEENQNGFPLFLLLSPAAFFPSASPWVLLAFVSGSVLFPSAFAGVLCPALLPWSFASCLILSPFLLPSASVHFFLLHPPRSFVLSLRLGLLLLTSFSVLFCPLPQFFLSISYLVSETATAAARRALQSSPQPRAVVGEPRNASLRCLT